MKVGCAMLIVLATAVGAQADWIVLNGMTYREVYVNEGRTMYFVHFPETGEVLNLPTSAVADDEIGIHEDEAYRRTLRDKWRENNPDRTRVSDHRNDVRRHVQEMTPPVPGPVMPHPGGHPGVLPDGGRENRALTYGARHRQTGATVNPATPTRTGQGQRQFAGTGGPPMARTPMGGQQRPGGGMMGGGMMGGGMMGGGMMGGGMMGGGRMGGGMMGGGMMGGGMMGGGMRDVTAIGNISDLFFTIDDRMVGEAPAVIQPMAVARPNTNRNNMPQFPR